MKRLFATLTLAAFAALLAPAQTAETSLQAKASSAVTAKEHSNVAQLYRDRATELNLKAAKHEKRASELRNQPAPPIAHKWPAMQPRPWEKESQLAMQARRAAEEATQLAARHTRLAAETQDKAADVE